MKKCYPVIILVYLIVVPSCFSQETSFQTELPQIAPPAPSVASMMKFEEVPVNNYTGTPDISIPLYSIASKNEEVGVNLSLSYHPGSINLSEVAGYTGLGWSLSGGGAVTRTVKGFPDEIFDQGKRIGIYRNAGGTEDNSYYTLIQNNPHHSEINSKFLYEGLEKGKYDTQHDLYQYSFAGRSGRFYLRKNTLNQLEVVRLDTGTDKILVSHDSNYVVTSFTIFDDRGYKYIFSVPEITTEHNASFWTNWLSQSNSSFQPAITYKSAFQLTEVRDRSNKVLISYTYNPMAFREDITESTSTTTVMLNESPTALAYDILANYGDVNNLEPAEKASSSLRQTETRKISHIDIKGKAKIEFVMAQGRQDSNLNNDAVSLDEIVIRDSLNNGIRKFKFGYDYQTVWEKRLILKSLTQSNFSDTSSLVHKMDYINRWIAGPDLRKDYWNFPTVIPVGHSGNYREPSPVYCTEGVLQKITYPEGGCTIYDFESNTYAYIGDEPVTNFDENPDNWTSHNYSTTFYTTRHNTISDAFNVPEDHHAFISVKVNWGDYPHNPDWFIAFMNNGNDFAVGQGMGHDCPGNDCFIKVQLPAGSYSLRFYSPDGNVVHPPSGFSAWVNVDYFKKVHPSAYKEYLYGGGIRIKKIGHFSQNVDQDYYSDPSPVVLPARELSYSYQKFGTVQEAKKSSGSLAFGKPVFDYTRNVSSHHRWGSLQTGLTITKTYRSITNFNSLKVLRTQGGDVGYQNVRISEKNNGYTEYTYTSPIDHPQESYSFVYPFLPGTNIDYKRGLLLSEKNFGESGLLLKETLNEYAVDDMTEMTGVSLVAYENCPFAFMYDSYAAYNASTHHNCGSVLSYISYPPIYEGFGWARLQTSIVNENFFNPSVTVGTRTSYTYNSLNRQIASKETEVYGSSEKIRTEYSYLNLPATNRISELNEIRTYRNTSLISNATKEFSTGLGSQSAVPSKIRVAKNAALEDRLQFTKYDKFGKLLSVKKPDGTSTCYVWGYHESYVIAKIEGVVSGYDSLNQSLVTAAINASNGNSESALSAALDNLRNGHPENMISTFTFQPLVGVASITDARGNKTTFEYDGFGRLIRARDLQGRILTENEYVVNSATQLNRIKASSYFSPSTNSDTNKALHVINYIDGLGRTIQQINQKMSGNGKNLVTHFEYEDFLNRQSKEFLTYESSSDSDAYEANAATDVLSFYLNWTDPTSNPYSEKVFEASRLNRVTELAAPGDDWANDYPTANSDHTIKYAYSANTVGDAVRRFTATADFATSSISLNELGNHDVGQLYKSVVKDENWTGGNENTTEEFKDKEGRIILRRNYGFSYVGQNGSLQNHDTYYVYDQYGNLTYVLPPKVDTASPVVNQLDPLCYQYKYDHRNRLVEKKIPGKQWEYIVYDKLDRIVATGPAHSPFSDHPQSILGWNITKYDKFNRAILGGWQQAAGEFTTSLRTSLQSSYNSDIILNESRRPGGTNTTIAPIQFNYTSDARPVSGYQVLSVAYFDDYDFDHAPATIPTAVMADSSQPVYFNKTRKPAGMETGSLLRVPQNSGQAYAETSYTLYDSLARPVRIRKASYLGGYTQADTRLDFSGKTRFSETRHKRSAVAPEILVREDFSYNAQQRLVSRTHKINNAAAQLLARNSYDALGQLISKRVGGTDISGTTSLQKVDYKFNVRGWLTAINDVDAPGNFTGDIVPSADPWDLFHFKVNYNIVEDQGAFQGQELYNGNISEVYWRTHNDNTRRKYSFNYDSMNRLTDAAYLKVYNGMAEYTGMYDEFIRYDKAGNIHSLYRTGDYDDSSFLMPLVIDNLKYTYGDPANPDRLTRVLDVSGNPSGFKDVSGLNDEYQYDSFGNMVSDIHKGITAISYNHLNLPKKISFANGNFIEYLYDALGSKVFKNVVENNNSSTTDYLDGFQYKDQLMELFPTAEGYVSVTGSQPPGGLGGILYRFSYAFNYLDHLGNVRLTFGVSSNKVKILSEDNYYPFGLKHRNYNVTRQQYEDSNGEIDIVTCTSCKYDYKYNGKEWQDELGLNLYDYGARNYGPAIGRWMNVDPLAEKSRRFSPYVYALNNPVYFIDPDGMEAAKHESFDDKDGQWYTGKNDGEIWLNKDGERVVDEKGNYTKHATAQEKQFGDALKSAGEEGQQMFKELTQSPVLVTVNFNEGNADSMLQGLMTPTEVKVNKDGSETLVAATLDINLGKIEAVNAEVKSTTTAEFNENHSSMSTQALDNLKTVKDNNMSRFEQAVGVFGHEIKHLDKDNFSMMRGIQKRQIRPRETLNHEYSPERVEAKILQGILNNR